MARVKQLALDVDVEMTAGSPFSITFTPTNSVVFTSPTIAYKTKGGDVVTGTAVPAATTDGDTVTLTWSSACSAANNTTTGKRGLVYSFEVQATVNGVGPVPLFGGESTVWPVGAVTSGAASATSASGTINVGGVAITGTVIIGSPAPDLTVRPQRAFTARLQDNGVGGPVRATLIGDSTGNDPTDWFRLFLPLLGASFPNWRIEHRLFSDTNQLYGAPTVVQAGSDAYTVGGVTTPDNAAHQLGATDIRIEAKVSLASAPASEQVIASQFGLAGNRAWRLYIDGSGLRFGYSLDGTTLVETTPISFASLTAGQTVAIDSPLYVGVTVDVTDGTNSRVQAIRSTDGGVTWANIGTPVVGPIITGLHNSTQTTNIGSRHVATAPFSGRIYDVNIYRGLTQADPLVLRYDASLCHGVTGFIDAEGRVWSFEAGTTFTAPGPFLAAMNASVAGATISYADDPTRRVVINAPSPDLTIINFGHNDTGTTLANYLTMVANIVGLAPFTSIVVCKQNPQHSTTTNAVAHLRQQQRLVQLAAREGWGVIDAFTAFYVGGNPDALVEVAGVHPLAAGYELWAATAASSFGV